MKYSDPVRAIRAAQPGLAIYGRVGEKTGELKTAILIREDNKRIRTIPKNPEIEIRTRLFKQDNIVLISLLLKINKELYETWWNYYQTGGGKQYFDDMASQKKLVILIFDSEKQRRAIQINNSLIDDFKHYKEIAQELPAWSMSEFDEAREKIYLLYPTVKKLWEAL